MADQRPSAPLQAFKSVIAASSRLNGERRSATARLTNVTTAFGDRALPVDSAVADEWGRLNAIRKSDAATATLSYNRETNSVQKRQAYTPASAQSHFGLSQFSTLSSGTRSNSFMLSVTTVSPSARA